MYFPDARYKFTSVTQSSIKGCFFSSNTSSTQSSIKGCFFSSNTPLTQSSNKGCFFSSNTSWHNQVLKVVSLVQTLPWHNQVLKVVSLVQTLPWHNQVLKVVSLVQTLPWHNQVLKVVSFVQTHHIGAVMVILPASTAVDHECQPWSRQIKDYEFGMCCFSTKRVLSRSKDKDCLARNEDNVSVWKYNAFTLFRNLK